MALLSSESFYQQVTEPEGGLGDPQTLNKKIVQGNNGAKLDLQGQKDWTPHIQAPARAFWPGPAGPCDPPFCGHCQGLWPRPVWESHFMNKRC